MIENREIYSFEEAGERTDSVVPETGGSEIEFENGEIGAAKFLRQMIIVVMCLIIATSLCRYEKGWAFWAREKLHYAINTSPESTFGVIWNSKFIQDIVRNGNNLVRLEKVTQILSDQVTFPDDNPFFKGSVWPVPGNIIQEYCGNGSPGSGVVMETTENARVIAVAAGKISRISQVTGGWLIEIDHGSGWSSVYQPITQLQIGMNQQVKTGQIIGRLEHQKLFLEIKHAGRSVNPRTVIR